MELNSNILNTLKALSGSFENKFDDAAYANLLKLVFDTFVINMKTGDFELSFPKDKIG